MKENKKSIQEREGEGGASLSHEGWLTYKSMASIFAFALGYATNV